jgi:hypothetical protein
MSVMSATVGVFSRSGQKNAVRNSRDINPEMDLQRNRTLRLKGDQRWRMIICHRGMVWITQQNDLEDYVLKPGDMFLISLRGEVVIQALQDASIEITHPLNATPYRGNFGYFA